VTAPPGPSRTPATIRALQAALAAQYATIYGYGIVGAHLTGNDRVAATDALQAHAALRDELIALVTAAGATPVAAQPAYQVPMPVTDTVSARALAAHLEQGDAGTAWDLIAASSAGSSLRSIAVGLLRDAALRAAHWGSQQALPGQPSAT
jgi:hypothetical protein